MLMPSQDEVLIAKDHPVVLSVAAPKEVGPFCYPVILIDNNICYH